MAEGIAIGRAIANELDAAKFDPLLSKAIAKGIVTSLEQMMSRWSNLVSSIIGQWIPVDLNGVGYLGCMGSDRRVAGRADRHPSTGLQCSAGFVLIPVLVPTRQAERRVWRRSF